MKNEPNLLRSPDQLFREWADRKHRRGCKCEWEEARKCARQKHLVGDMCKCVCHAKDAV